MTGLPEGVWLNVGSGPNAPDGWTSIDGSWQAWLAARPLLARAARLLTGRETGHWPTGIVCRDIRHGLGLAAGSAAVIYSSHFIEHLRRDEALAFLEDAFATLAPGGVCRIVTPDLAAMVTEYLAGARAANDGAAAEQLIASSLLAPPGAAPSGPLAWYRASTNFDAHKWLYDAASLKALFREAGFAHPEQREVLDSHVPMPRLAQVEIPERITGGTGIAVEAVR